MGARAKRAARLRAILPIVEQLEAHGTECDNDWMTRSASVPTWPWLTTPFSINPRGDDVLAESNYRVIKADLESVAMDVDYRIDLWPGGTIHTLMVRADDAAALRRVEGWVAALSDYPVADESDYSELEWETNHPSDGECYSEDEDCPCGNKATEWRLSP